MVISRCFLLIDATGGDNNPRFKHLSKFKVLYLKLQEESFFPFIVEASPRVISTTRRSGFILMLQLLNMKQRNREFSWEPWLTSEFYIIENIFSCPCSTYSFNHLKENKQVFLVLASPKFQASFSLFLFQLHSVE